MYSTRNNKQQVVGFSNPQAQLAPLFGPGMGPSPLVVGSAPVLPPAMFTEPVNPVSSILPVGPPRQHEGYEKRTKGLKRPDQPHRPIPPACEEPAEVTVKLATCKNTANYAGRVVGSINPLWTVAELKQHFELQANLGGIPANKQALRMERPAAPGFDSAEFLDDVVLLKYIGVNRGAPACVIWLERCMESGDIPAMAVAPAGAPTGLQLLFPFSTTDGNQAQHHVQLQLQQLQHQHHQQQQLRHQLQLRQQVQYQQRVRQRVLQEEKNTVTGFQGPIVRPSQPRSGGAVAGVVGPTPQEAPRQAVSNEPAGLRQREPPRAWRQSNHHQQRHHPFQRPKDQHRVSKPQGKRSKPQQQQRALPAEHSVVTLGLPGVSATELEQYHQQREPRQTLGQMWADLDDSPIVVDNGHEINDDNDFLNVLSHVRPESDVSAIVNGSRILTQRRQRQPQ
ncbi:hypothetical protein NCU03577 [Neurospora crassa OR74A]|uniref:Uncharacterized protein n=1 Tax=Neurospora crassa (strain ATCC 24698 / 74-OR23-1A / CBS 708.71 / DSM 1257 / FGSC 987) TaxID=367110 RepID=Q7RWI6_NEUCR|nr:hypothetical protein NCU03577 [Neurospora crassa OR74A]EAA26780.1 hypothetical protein NCU03577 [Neurospora crassa OR74A]|eukprot:XP_956016.1 hypothetical protein NCU03577 [Neurospora crassa OR74A]